MEHHLEEGIRATPVASRKSWLEDSGYHTSTPESTDSVRTLNVFSQTSGQVPPIKFTPETSSYKPVQYIFNRNRPKSFPISSEDSEVISILEESELTWRSHDMCSDDTDSEMCIKFSEHTQEDGTYSPDCYERSLYDRPTVQREHGNVFGKENSGFKDSEMEIDQDMPLFGPHPNSENEDSNLLEERQPEQLVGEAFTRRLSLETTAGQSLLVQKLQDLQTCQDKRKVINNIAPTWRQKLKEKGCRYAEDLTGKSTVDFLLYLGVYSNHSSVISNILSYLSPSDLQACTYVSTDWRNICSKDHHSVLRLENYKRQSSYVNKENFNKKKLHSGVHQFGPLVTISNFQHNRVSPPPTPVVSPSKVRSREFVDVSNKEDVVCMHCPKCRFPAKVNKAIFEAKCDKQNCQYLFCTNCRYQAHRPKPCVTVSGRKARKRGASTVGSKESRKNLRRLL